MKRDYSYLPIIAIFLINGILVMIFQSLLKDYNDIFRVIIGFIVNFIIFSGLLHTRNGGFVDYISNIKRINLNVVLINIVSSLATALFMILALIPVGVSKNPKDLTINSSFDSIRNNYNYYDNYSNFGNYL